MIYFGGGHFIHRSGSGVLAAWLAKNHTAYHHEIEITLSLFCLCRFFCSGGSTNEVDDLYDMAGHSVYYYYSEAPFLS